MLAFAMTIGLCFLAAIFEGLDIQSMGVAAPRLATAFHLNAGTLGIVMSASTAGLMLGAALGGWLSDRVGRKAVLIGSMLVLSLFSLFTAISRDVQWLLLARVLAGVGLGGVFPSLIALIADAAPTRSRAMSLGVMYCGLPLGGALAGLVMAGAAPGDWRLVFEVGGIGPLVVAAALIFLPPPAARPETTTEGAPATGDFSRLFGPRTETTLLLWVAYFFTLFAIYIQLNWMPSFLHAKGFTLAQASLAAVVLNVGAAIGSLVFGRIMDGVGPRRLLPAVYVGMALSLFCLAFATAGLLPFAVFFAGLFVIGGQLVLYALGPMLYAPAVRGAGVGAAVSAGRGGAILGPILAGLALGRGLSPSAVPLIAEPGLVLACAAILWVAHRNRTFAS